MSGSPGSDQGIESFFLTFAPLTPKIDEHKCASSFNIPSLTSYCPPSLIQCAYLNNYYSQYIFDAAVTSSVMPNAIYIDGVYVNGTIQTGENSDHLYAYVDSILLINVERICKKNKIGRFHS